MRVKVNSITITILLFTIMVTATLEPAVAVTWSVNITQLTSYDFFDGLSAITQTSDGRIWIVWTRDILGKSVLFYETSSDLGTTWSEEENITEILAPEQNTSPSIVQLANGTIMVVWSSNKVVPGPPPEPDFSMDASPNNLTIPKGDSGNSTIAITSLWNFSEPVNLTVWKMPPDVNTTLDPAQVTPPAYGSANSNLTVSVETTAMTGNHTLLVRGQSENKTHYVAIALEIIESGTATGSTTSSSLSPSSETEDYEIFYKTSNDNGASWSNNIQLTNNTVDDASPSVVQLTNGTIMLVWQSDRTGNPDLFYMTSNGTSWSDATQLTTSFTLDMGPSVMQAKDERIWVAWASDRTVDYEIYYKTYDGLSWSGDRRLTFSPDSDSAPSILQTIDDTIWIFWTSTGDIYYKYTLDNGLYWSDSVQFTTSGYEDVWSSVCQTRDTKIWVVWTSNRGEQPDGNWDIYYKTSLAGDVNEDGEIDIFDLAIVGLAYGRREGFPGYNPDADINKDGIVDARDLAIVTFYFGES